MSAKVILAVLVSIVAIIVQACGGEKKSEWTVLQDLQYGNNVRQVLDLHLPPKDASGRVPALIVFIHGGGWAVGSKNEITTEMSEHPGYAMASINYRLSREAIFPAQLYDCKAAIRWLRAHATQYHYDPNRIGVWGSSAGGELAALLGTTGGDKRFEGDVGDTVVSSKVQAVCDWCGPSDLVAIQKEAGPENLLRVHDKNGRVAQYLGGMPEDRRALADMANPCLHAKAGDPPFLIMHGDADRVVPVQQSYDLYKALQAAHVQSQLIIIPGADHNFYAAEPLARTQAFFDQVLQTKPSDDQKKIKSQPEPAAH